MGTRPTLSPSCVRSCSSFIVASTADLDEGSRRQHPKFANAQVDASLEHFAAIPTGPGSDFHVIRSNRD